MTDTMTGTQFNLTPEPRILPMLGEINLDQWRCLAELIDNSVDGFLWAKRAGTLIYQPEVSVSVPTSDRSDAKVIIRDNGPGMDAKRLERAVSAGWTSNDPVHNLGLYGMGFNIATARLGTTTSVWTTRKEDSEWYGLKIDFDELIRNKSFTTPRLTRPKIERETQGTEIVIERLKPEQIRWFASTTNRTKVGKQLSRSYSAMLRPNGDPISFRLLLNGNAVVGMNHCVWGSEESSPRVVTTARYGNVNAYYPINYEMPDRPFCLRCWQWLLAGEQSCPSCESADQVMQRQRRIRGWLGIQRYLSSTEYGIDFLRHGRKIEIANKDLFQWNDGERIETEYPIDDPRNRGRIVGEIHIDHCRVTYMKDRFDRNDPAWEEMVRVVRGDGPLRPDVARELGCGPNTSPLSLLFQAFRRSSPKPKVAGCYAKLLIIPNNELAETMARRFHDGDHVYQSDSKWWELVEEADSGLLGAVLSSGASDPPPAPPGFEDFGSAPPPGDQTIPTTPTPSGSVSTRQPSPGISLPSLGREYKDEITGLRWAVTAYEVSAADETLKNAGAPWVLTATAGGEYDFLVNPSDPVFQSETMTPLDALLSELAAAAMDFQRDLDGTAKYGKILAGLRRQYAGSNRLDPETLCGEASIILRSMARSLAKHLAKGEGAALYNELTLEEKEAITEKMVIRSVRNPQQQIENGRFLEFAPRVTLLNFFEKHPELFMDGRYWDTEYSTLDYGRTSATESARVRVIRDYLNLLADVVWLEEQDPSDLAVVASRARLLRAKLAIELLSLNADAEG